METILLITITALLLLAIILIIVFRNKGGNELPQLQNIVTDLQSSLGKIESGLKEDFRINREENAGISKDNRIELNTTLKNITEQSQIALKEINKTLEEKLDELTKQIEANNKTNREELTKNITDFSGA